MKQNNFYYLFFGVILCVSNFLMLDASYPIAPETQGVEGQQYDQLPKWNYAHPIYALNGDGAKQADETQSDHKQAPLSQSAHFLQVPQVQVLFKARAVKKSNAEAKKIAEK